MEASPVSTVAEVLERMEELRRLARELSARARRAQGHAAAAGGAGGAGGAPAGVDLRDVQARAEAVLDQHDALRMILAVQAQRIREQGFEFELDMEPASDAEDAVSGSTTTESTPAPDAGRSKKPRLSPAADFQAGYTPYENWCARSLEEDSSCAEEAADTLGRLEGELAQQRVQFAPVTEIHSRLSAQPGLEEEAALHAASIAELQRRWDGVQSRARALRDTLALLRERDALLAEAARMRAALDDTRSWLARSRPAPPSANRLIHLRNRLRALRHLQPALQELDARAIVLATRPLPQAHRDEVRAAVRAVVAGHEELLAALAGEEADTKAAVARKPEGEAEDEFETLQRQIRAIESRVIVEHAMFAAADAMRARAAELTKVRGELVRLRGRYEAVVQERRQRREAGSAPDLDRGSSLEDLVARFGDTHVLLDQKIAKLENGVALVEELESNVAELKRWLEKVEKFVADNEHVPVGDVARLETLLAASNDLDEEKEKYQTLLASCEKSRDTILEDCDGSFAATLKADGELGRRLARGAARALALNEGLRRALERSEGVFRQIGAMEDWLLELEGQIPKEEDCRISDSAELYRVKMTFQALKDKCDEKTEEFRNLNEAGNDIMLAAESARPAALARRLTALSARWTEVTRGVYERYKVLAEAWHESGELRARLAQEAAWLDGLERRLRAQHAPADAEELSAQLADLESYMQNRSSPRLASIREVGAALAAAHIMPRWVTQEVDGLGARWEKLQAEAAALTTSLEGAARAAARSELAVDGLQQWLRDAAAALRDPQAADQRQLEAQRAALAQAAAQVQEYQAAGHTQAAARLRDQLDTLQLNGPQRQFDECCSQLSCEAAEGGPGGGGLEARLARAMAALRGVQAGADDLALTSAAPDDVRAVLRRCLVSTVPRAPCTIPHTPYPYPVPHTPYPIPRTPYPYPVPRTPYPIPRTHTPYPIPHTPYPIPKLYRALSEIKAEVETVIKQGRRAAEEGGAGAEGLSARVDALKELYNRLGACVTAGKARLEAALLTARELQGDAAALDAWLAALGAPPRQAPGAQPRQALELEMSRMQAVRDKLRANCEDYAALAAPEALGPLRARLAELDARWDRLRRHGAGPPPLPALLDEAEREAAAPARPPARAARRAARARRRGARRRARAGRALPGRARRLAGRRRRAVRARVGHRQAAALARAGRPRRPRRAPLSRAAQAQPHPAGAAQPGAAAPLAARRAPQHHAGAAAPLPARAPPTIGLLDSALFAQAAAPPPPPPRRAVAVREHEILKATVSPEPAPAVSEEALHFVPQRAEAVEVLDDPTGRDSDDDHRLPAPGKRPSVDLGTEPKTFVVEVKTLEQRMRPTLGVLKRRHGADEERQRAVKISLPAPDVVPAGGRTPPPTPADGAAPAPPPLELAARLARRDELDEYRFLDEAPPDRAALPEPSATATAAALVADTVTVAGEHPEPTDDSASEIDEPLREPTPEIITEERAIEADDVAERQMKPKPEDEPEGEAAPDANDIVQISTVETNETMNEAGPETEKTVHEDILEADDPRDDRSPAGSEPAGRDRDTSSEAAEEVIYSEVEDVPQSRAEAPEYELPLCSSTPLKPEAATVVGMSPKAERAGARPGEAGPPRPLPAARELSPLSPLSPESPESPGPAALLAALPAQDAELAAFAAAAAGARRRMDVALITVGGVDAEKDPGKRLEILKNQLGALAPVAAALISRGDSLVLARHRDSPLLAECIQAALTDRLRHQWARLLAEIEAKRGVAMRAEDDAKELARLLDGLQRWLKRVEAGVRGGAGGAGDAARRELPQREAELERVQELCRALRAARAGHPERAAADVAAAWPRVKQLYDQDDDLANDKKGKNSAALYGAYVTAANQSRAGVAAAARALSSPPLGARDYDDFPLQEDALEKVKTAIAELEPKIQETEKQFSSLEGGSGAAAARAARVRGKLRQEWAALKDNYTQRHEK
ncbi:hypothetical protein MSG28_011630 [Choristoneura fumiferana]|uniref:Uncharacterized protein n=1 Tax=Choristoneura fumiferana TaxID=7141 RepID=A0ACC0KLK6_CHOFU|nr:hypothetical protein MSG28_011630 [Choristoneura fumiferana]